MDLMIVPVDVLCNALEESNLKRNEQDKIPVHVLDIQTVKDLLALNNTCPFDYSEISSIKLNVSLFKDTLKLILDAGEILYGKLSANDLDQNHEINIAINNDEGQEHDHSDLVIRGGYSTFGY